MLAVAAGLLLALLLEGAGRGVAQPQAHAVLLAGGRPLGSRRDEHGGAVLEGCGAGHGAGHTGVVGQAGVAVARG